MGSYGSMVASVELYDGNTINGGDTIALASARLRVRRINWIQGEKGRSTYSGNVDHTSQYVLRIQAVIILHGQ